MRSCSPRIPILTVVALATFTSLFGLWYAYSRAVELPWEETGTPSNTVGSGSSPPGNNLGLSAGHPIVTPADNANKTSRIAKISVAANKLDNEMIHRALRSHQKHNEMHGYKHFTATQEAVGGLIENPEDRRPKGAWTKPAYILSLIVAELEKPEDERLQWFFWFDADTIVANPQTPLDVFLPPESNTDLDPVHLLLASNWDGLNSGVFALRVHPWSVSLLSAILAYPIYKADRIEKDRFRDQSAFQYLLQDEKSPLAEVPTKSKDHWAVVPMRWFNSLPVNNAFHKKTGAWFFGKKMVESGLFDNGTTDVYDDGHGGEVRPWKVMQGDLIVHFAGSTVGGTRDSWMGPWLDRVEADLPQWSNVSTQYVLREEAGAFWDKEATRVAQVTVEGKKVEAERKAAAEKKKKEEEELKKAEEERKKAEGKVAGNS